MADRINSNEKQVKTSTLSDFDIGCPLGTGKFGHVYLAKTKKDGFVCALKIMFKSQLVKYRMEHQFAREIEIMINLDHPNILKLYTWFHDSSRIYLVLEYAWYGQMYTLLNQKKRFSEQEAATYLYQLCDALIHCHSRGVIHRDIKPENLLISHDYQLKLADFGWSVHSSTMRRKTRCGTLDYLSPEIVNKTVYDEKIDHWTVGILLYEMLHGVPPFERSSEHETFAAIRSVDLNFKSYISAEASDLITKILKFTPSERLSLTGIKNHVWMMENVCQETLARFRERNKTK